MPSPYPSPQPVRFAVLRENAIKWQITLLVCRTVCTCVLVVQQGILLTHTHAHTAKRICRRKQAQQIVAVIYSNLYEKKTVGKTPAENAKKQLKYN